MIDLKKNFILTILCFSTHSLLVPNDTLAMTCQEVFNLDKNDNSEYYHLRNNSSVKSDWEFVQRLKLWDPNGKLVTDLRFPDREITSVEVVRDQANVIRRILLLQEKPGSKQMWTVEVNNGKIQSNSNDGLLRIDKMEFFFKSIIELYSEGRYRLSDGH